MIDSLFMPQRSATNLTACYARYQSDTAVGQYCDAHYGPTRFGVGNFPQTLARLCIEAGGGAPQHTALDLGCSVGRTTFELAGHFEHVTGIDFSSRFIDIANRIKRRGRISYKLPEEGALISDHEMSLADFNLMTTAHRVTFTQGDAQCLETDFRDFDLVVAANLIDRLPDPSKFLAGIHHRLTVGGLLVIASPYDWLEHYTPQNQWLGGRFRSGKTLTTLEGLGEKLARHFTIIGEPRDVEFVIRETARTFHHSVSQVTIWRRIADQRKARTLKLVEQCFQNSH